MFFSFFVIVVGQGHPSTCGAVRDLRDGILRGEGVGKGKRAGEWQEEMGGEEEWENLSTA